MIDPSLPLVDLHRHLDGAVRLSTILDLGEQHGLPLPAWDEEGLRPHVQVVEPEPDLMGFIGKFRWMVGVLADYDACRRVACESVEDAAREGLAYVELRFSPLFMAEPHGLDPAGVVEAVLDGIAAGARDTGVRATAIGILTRSWGPEAAFRELDALLTQRHRIAALDLAGDEARFPGDLFVEHFRRGRDAGWRITVHAGEAAGAASVWQALTDLGAERIGHGVRAAEDPALLDHLARHGVGLEVCPTSNVHTSTFRSYRESPLRALLEQGLLATLNTDDPGISGIDLPHEYRVAAPACGLTPELARRAQENALAVAFLSAAEKAELTRAAAAR